MTEKNNRLFGGVYSYVMTPFDKKGDVDHGVLIDYIEGLIEAGLDGLTLMASTTEALYLQEHERKSVIETVCKTVRGRAVINAGVGALSTKQALYFAEHAKDQGADRIIADMPTYFPLSFDDVYQHYSTLSEKINLPIRVYNISQPTRYDFIPEQVLKMTDIEMVDSFKEATGDPERTRDVVALCGDRVQIYCGFHWMLLQALSYGAVGWEGGMHPIFAKECVQLYRDAMEDVHDKKVHVQFERLKPLFFFMKTFGVTPTIKAMSDWTDLKLGVPRPPLAPLPEAMKGRLRYIIKELGMI